MKVANSHLKEQELEDAKGVIRIHKSTDRQGNGQKKRTKGQTTVYKTLNIELEI